MPPETPPKTLLWPDQAISSTPDLTIFPADKPNGAGVLVCPGGGYGGLATDHEGEQIGRWLNERGFSAWMLRYSTQATHATPLLSRPLDEAKRAMRLIRSRADEWNLKTDRLGVWGFSAGGHLASTLATHWDAGLAGAQSIERQSSRPDFQILAYPVVTMDSWTHGGSRTNLLGEKPDARLIEEYSNERHINANTPPAFLFHTADDPVVPVANSLKYFEALHEAKIAAEMHIYEHGPHGVGLAGGDKILSTWPARLNDWLQKYATQ